jgi:hypothetical protein
MSDEIARRVLEGELVDREVAGSVRVLAMKSPFSFARTETFVAEGKTLASILADLELEDWKDALVSIDGHPVPPNMWQFVRPRADHLVCIRVVPRGGGSSGDKGWLQVAAGIILIVVGVVLLLYGLPFAVPVIALGVSLALGGALSLIFPPPSLPRLKSGSGSDSPVFSITGTRNTANPYGAICRVYGRHKIFPSERSHS